MPTVPTAPDAPTVTPQELQPPSMDRLLYRSIGTGGEQLVQAGRGLMGLGQVEAANATDELNMVNQVRVNDAMNQARQQALDLTYGTGSDPSSGYLNRKGAAAAGNPDSGQPLSQEYTQKLQDGISQISDSLGNDAQRRMFQMQSGNLLQNFNESVQKHAASEFNSYAQSTQDGTVKLAANAAKLGWDNPDTVQQSVDQAKAAVYQSGKLQGWSGAETTARMQTTVSAIHSGVISSALENNNPLYAMSYLQQHKGEMTADDILRMSGTLNKEVDSHVANAAVTQTGQKFQTQLAPTDMNRLHSLVLNQESGARDYDASGAPITSPKGALFASQVLPSTAAAPGFGIQPAQAQTPAEYNRVGSQYLDAMVQKYGNVNQALAAYNAGPAAVDKAVADAKAANDPNWLARLPKETQDYVGKIGAQFASGGGAPALPTKEQFVEDAIARLGDNPRMEQVLLTRQQAEHQYATILQSRKETADNALTNAQQALISNGGNFNALDPQTRMTLASTDPDNYKKAMDFAKSIQNPARVSDPKVYAALTTYPEDMAKIPDADWMQMRSSLSDADFNHFTNARADLLNGKTDQSAGAINTKALTTALNERLTNIGIEATPKKTDAEGLARVGTIQKFLQDGIFDQQQQLGRKMTAQEISSYVDHQFAKNVTFRNTFMGVSTGTDTQPMLGLKFGDLADDVKSAINQRMPNASDGDKLRAYWIWKNKRNGG